MLPHSKLVTLTTLTFKGYDTMSLCLREIRKEEPVVDSVVVLHLNSIHLQEMYRT